MKFTARSVEALKTKTTRYEIWEDGRKGFGLRVSPKGRKTWVYLYRFDGKSRRMSFGTFPAVTLASAHLLHSQAEDTLGNGIDPGAVQQNQNHLENTAPTVAELADEYLEKWAKPRKRSWKEDQRILNRDVLPPWGSRKAKDITRRNVVLLLDKIVDRGSPIAANRTLAVIRKMFNFALSRDIIETTPCAAITAPAKENRRDRVLSLDELRSFWTNLPDARISEQIQIALKLQLVTGQRKGEVVGAQWTEIDMHAAWWTIPATKAKNGLTHRVPLSSLALELLDRLKQTESPENWLFPSPTTDSHITEEAVTRAIKRNLDVLKTGPFTPHDLRRSAASHMTSLGIPRLVVRKLLNHKDNETTAIYDRHSYDAEKCQALHQWSEKLNTVITDQPLPTNVLSIR